MMRLGRRASKASGATTNVYVNAAQPLASESLGRADPGPVSQRHRAEFPE